MIFPFSSFVYFFFPYISGHITCLFNLILEFKLRKQKDAELQFKFKFKSNNWKKLNWILVETEFQLWQSYLDRETLCFPNALYYISLNCRSSKSLSCHSNSTSCQHGHCNSNSHSWTKNGASSILNFAQAWLMQFTHPIFDVLHLMADANAFIKSGTERQVCHSEEWVI